MDLTNPDLDAFAKGFILLFPIIVQLFITGSTTVGVWILYRGITLAVKDSPQLTNDMKSHNLIVHLISGSFMIAMPFQVYSFNISFFPDDTDESLLTAIDESFYNTVTNIQNGGEETILYNALAAAAFAAVTIILGLFAFIRGWYLISKMAENGSMMQRETTTAQIASHIIGGFILMQMWRLVIV